MRKAVFICVVGAASFMGYRMNQENLALKARSIQLEQQLSAVEQRLAKADFLIQREKASESATVSQLQKELESRKSELSVAEQGLAEHRNLGNEAAKQFPQAQESVDGRRREVAALEQELRQASVSLKASLSQGKAARQQDGVDERNSMEAAKSRVQGADQSVRETEKEIAVLKRVKGNPDALSQKLVLENRLRDEQGVLAAARSDRDAWVEKWVVYHQELKAHQDPKYQGTGDSENQIRSKLDTARSRLRAAEAQSKDWKRSKDQVSEETHQMEVRAQGLRDTVKNLELRLKSEQAKLRSVVSSE